MNTQFSANRVAKVLVGAVAATLMASPAFAAPAAAPAPAPAPAQVSLKTEVMLEKTVTESGKSSVQLVEPKIVVPGDRLVYTMRYHNDGALPATNYVMVDPLPSAVVLASDGAFAGEVSVDGGKSWGPLASLKVSDGKGGLRPAASSDVTHLRWTIAQIAPGASGQVEFHAIVR